MEQNSDCNPSWSVDTITTFEKNMLKLENIDLKRINSNGEKVKKLFSLRQYALIDLYLNIRLLYYKGYLCNEQNVSLETEDMFDIASPIICKKMDYDNNITAKIVPLEEDKQQIKYYQGLYNDLTRFIKPNIKDFKALFSNSKHMKHRRSEKAYIEDIIILKRLKQLGIENYTKKVIYETLGEVFDYGTVSAKQKVLAKLQASQ